jgi:hypothetical protein
MVRERCPWFRRLLIATEKELAWQLGSGPQGRAANFDCWPIIEDDTRQAILISHNGRLAGQTVAVGPAAAVSHLRNNQRHARPFQSGPGRDERSRY